MGHHLKLALMTALGLVLISCGTVAPRAATSSLATEITVGITEHSSTSVTTTSATGTPTTTGRVQIAIPGREDVIMITTPDSSERRLAEDTTTEMISDEPEELGEEPVSEGRVFCLSPFVVIGKVASIEGPFWNQANGQKWTDEFGEGPVPRLYREVSVDIERVIADDADLVGDSLALIVGGGGTPREVQPWLGGKFVVDERFLLFFEVRPWSQRDERLLTFSPVWGRGRGVYHLVDQDGLTYAIPDWETHNGHDQISTPDPKSFDSLDRVVERIEEIRSSTHPPWDKFKPTKKWILASILYYQNWVRTGQMLCRPSKMQLENNDDFVARCSQRSDDLAGKELYT